MTLRTKGERDDQKSFMRGGRVGGAELCDAARVSPVVLFLGLSANILERDRIAGKPIETSRCQSPHGWPCSVVLESGPAARPRMHLVGSGAERALSASSPESSRDRVRRTVMRCDPDPRGVRVLAEEVPGREPRDAPSMRHRSALPPTQCGRLAKDHAARDEKVG